MSKARLDALDRQIIELLGRDARVSNRQIATDLRVTEGTVRTRLKRLQQHRAIQFAVVMDPNMAGSPTLVMLGIHADPRCVPQLTQKLAGIPIISCVVRLLGRYSVLAMGYFADLEAANELVRATILSLPGVRQVEISLVASSFKYQVHMARIIGGQPC